METADVAKCYCCYPCVKKDAEDGCSDCRELLDTFLPQKSSLKLSKKVSSELKSALGELFAAMDVKDVAVENNLLMSVSSFVPDITKLVDEIKAASDISSIWHTSSEVASKVFETMEEVLYGEDLAIESEDSSDSSEEGDEFDVDSESSDADDDTLPFGVFDE